MPWRTARIRAHQDQPFLIQSSSVPAVNSPADLAAAIQGRDRAALARGITLVESRRPIDVAAAAELLQALLPHTGASVRIGITGTPGVGKSTLIEALGLRLTNAGHRVAVLAVDPSSARTGGSILGDKTRMAELSRDARAFIRPSPGGDTLGGVTAHTREALLLCEAAGFDVVLVETIGTGQSEVAVHGMVDFFLLLLSPAAGDELQGIKRGVMELADGILVHKADGDLAAAAERAAWQCLLAMRILRSGDGEPPPVLVGSAVTGRGLDELWRTIEQWFAAARHSGALAARRARQATAWLEDAVREQIFAAYLADPSMAAAMAKARADVAAGIRLPSRAAADIVDAARRDRC
jgi:LAO/AO transport system kinase